MDQSLEMSASVRSLAFVTFVRVCYLARKLSASLDDGDWRFVVWNRIDSALVHGKCRRRYVLLVSTRRVSVNVNVYNDKGIQTDACVDSVSFAEC